MYRERHSVDCETNGSAFMASQVDDALGALIENLELPEDWQERISRTAAKIDAGDIIKLKEQRRRLVRAYADGGYEDAEYARVLTHLDARIRAAEPTSMVAARDARTLLTDVKGLWSEATPDERRRLVAPLIDRVYVDVETREICALSPSEGFAALLGAALRKSCQPATLVSVDAADWREVWTWWRRGRIELPVQAEDALSLLQAYPVSLISLRAPAAGPAARSQLDDLGHSASASGAPHPG